MVAKMLQEGVFGVFCVYCCTMDTTGDGVFNSFGKSLAQPRQDHFTGIHLRYPFRSRSRPDGFSNVLRYRISPRFSEALPRTFDAGLFSSLPIRFGQFGIAELYSAKIRENPKDAEYNSAIPGKTERFDQTNRYH